MPCAHDGQIRAIGALRAPSSFFDGRAGPRVDFAVRRALPRYDPARESHKADHVLAASTGSGENELYSPRGRLLHACGATAGTTLSGLISKFWIMIFNDPETGS